MLKLSYISTTYATSTTDSGVHGSSVSRNRFTVSLLWLVWPTGPNFSPWLIAVAEEFLLSSKGEVESSWPDYAVICFTV